jgi:hypothetical protein
MPFSRVFENEIDEIGLRADARNAEGVVCFPREFEEKMKNFDD